MPTPAIDRRRRATPADARTHNRTMVLSTLLHHGRLSRTDLATATGMTRTSMTDIVGDLVAEGLLVEQGPRESTGLGRPAILLDLNREHAVVVALDLSDHRCFRGALLTLDSVVLEHREVDLHDATGSVALQLVGRLIDDLVGASTIDVLGVGTPGTVSDGGRKVHATALGWERVDLVAFVATHFAGPVLVVNDANAAAVAEYRFNGGAADLVLVRLGRGVGAGVLIDGRSHEGRRAIAGELGHVTVGDGAGPECPCGRTGCLESWIAVPKLTAMAADADRAEEFPAALAQAGTRLAMVLAPVVSALDSTEVVLSGPHGLLEGSLLEAATTTLHRRVLTSPTPPVDVRISTTDDAVIRGASARLVERELGIS